MSRVSLSLHDSYTVTFHAQLDRSRVGFCGKYQKYLTRRSFNSTALAYQRWQQRVLRPFVKPTIPLTILSVGRWRTRIVITLCSVWIWRNTFLRGAEHGEVLKCWYFTLQVHRWKFLQNYKARNGTTWDLLAIFFDEVLHVGVNITSYNALRARSFEAGPRWKNCLYCVKVSPYNTMKPLWSFKKSQENMCSRRGKSSILQSLFLLSLIGSLAYCLFLYNTTTLQLDECKHQNERSMRQRESLASQLQGMCYQKTCFSFDLVFWSFSGY